MPQPLPIDAFLPDIMQALARHKSLVLSAPPGSGKTTRVPPALMNADWLGGKKILMLEPRRLATRAAARRMADERDENPGEVIGYRVRFDHCVSAQTRIEVVTEAILTRRLQSDPELSDVGLVIFDEFHERNLNSDLGLALCLDVQGALREDLKLLIMSATLNSDDLLGVLDDAVHVEAAGRSYPVDVVYLPKEPQGRLETSVVVTVMDVLARHKGDVLVFLPGGGEIRRVEEHLKPRLMADTVVLPLFGDLNVEAQDQALVADKQGRRKIVLATPIAETSLTIPGVTVVVDSGWAKVPQFDPNSGLTRLQTQRISRASATQRAGRAGRTQPGICYRQWTETTQQGLLAHQASEIATADLATLALELALWGVDKAADLSWVEPPSVGGMAQAQGLLRELGLVDGNKRITSLGKRLSGFGAHPRIAVMLEQSKALNLGGLAADVAALMSERDVFRGGERISVDVSLRLDALAVFRRRGRNGARQYGADPGACAHVERAASQWRRMLKLKKEAVAFDIHKAGMLFALAYPDRIAQRREGESGGYRMSGGAGALLPMGDALAHKSWLVAGRLNAAVKGGGAMIQMAAEVQLDELETVFKQRIENHQSVVWDARSKRVRAMSQRCIGKVVLAEKVWQDAPSDQVQKALVTGLKQLGLQVLPWNKELETWRNRVAFLRAEQGAEHWPDYADEALLASLDEWLLPYLDGMSRIEHLSKLDLRAVFTGQMDWDQQQRLEQLAPSHLKVPSGSRIPIEYVRDKPPVLPVRLQEMFGLADTPRLVNGKVPVLLHLLSPARRPIQVTQDLSGFWQRTYEDVKKELKGRYPKHYWPDDPLQSQPTARAKPRRR